MVYYDDYIDDNDHNNDDDSNDVDNDEDDDLLCLLPPCFHPWVKICACAIIYAFPSLGR